MRGGTGAGEHPSPDTGVSDSATPQNHLGIFLKDRFMRGSGEAPGNLHFHKHVVTGSG